MLPEDEFFRNHSEEEIWQRYCSFLDLSIADFMSIQRHLLMEQAELVADSPLGREIMNNHKPRSVEEFRSAVPLTTYRNYEPYLSEKREDILAEKPFLWCHTAGRGGHFKWVPYTRRALEVAALRFLGLLILANAPSRGQVLLRPGYRMLMLLAPPPYISGSAVQYVADHCFSLQVIPPLEGAEGIEFRDRIARGFQIALRSGVDEICSIASVLVKVGEAMSLQAQSVRPSLSLLHPAVLLRLTRGLLRSRLARRPMLPSDLWQAKALLTGGTDTAIYKNEVRHYWGQTPYEIYGATEAIPIAAQAWNKKWLTFVPDTAFLEFIPETERQKGLEDEAYQPATVLSDELKPGKNYEIVLTQLHGMPLLRYRLGDLITVVALGDEEAGVNLPQIVFKARVEEIISLAGLTELDEKTIWQAIINTGVNCEEWSARKEYHQNQTYLRLYLELKESREPAEMEPLIHTQLQALDVDYRDIASWLELQPVRVTPLSKGTFRRYYEERQREGADLAHLKPPHMNAADSVIQRLLRLSQ